MQTLKLEGLFTYFDDRYDQMVLCLFDDKYIQKLKNTNCKVTEYNRAPDDEIRARASVRIKVPKSSELNVFIRQYISLEVTVKVRIKNYNFVNKEGDQKIGKSLYLQCID